MIPALLTRTSSGPEVALGAVEEGGERALVRDVQGVGADPVGRPELGGGRLGRGDVESPMATLIPSRSMARAVSRPMPRAPPVMAATWPVRMRGCLAMLRLLGLRANRDATVILPCRRGRQVAAGRI
jgi:hypothetical protein